MVIIISVLFFILKLFFSAPILIMLSGNFVFSLEKLHISKEYTEVPFDSFFFFFEMFWELKKYIKYLDYVCLFIRS